jgi:hypothetical protein
VLTDVIVPSNGISRLSSSRIVIVRLTNFEALLA